MFKKDYNNIPNIVTTISNMFKHPQDAEDFFKQLNDPNTLKQISNYANMYARHEGAKIEMINNLIIDRVEDRMLSKEEEDRHIYQQEQTERQAEHSIESIMSKSIPNYNKWENNNG